VKEGCGQCDCVCVWGRYVGGKLGGDCEGEADTAVVDACQAGVITGRPLCI